MKILKYLLWLPIIAFVLILMGAMFCLILDIELGNTLGRVWATLGLVSFFCLILIFKNK